MITSKTARSPYNALAATTLILLTLLTSACSSKSSSEGGPATQSSVNDNALHPLLAEIGNGCWPREGTDTANHHWCGPEGEISITNPGASERSIVIEGSFGTQSAPGILTVEGPGISSKLDIDKNGVPWKFEIPVKPGVTQVHLRCDCKRVIAPQDPRAMYFNIINFQFHEVGSR